jgi:hypothetical protein
MSKFRETLWFKRGDAEEAVADEAVPQDAQRPLEDRYLDDGSLTSADRDAYSVRTGGTQWLPKVDALASEPVDIALVAELKRGRAGILAVLGTSAALIFTAIALQAF